jgi:hypothetical protein
LNLGYPPLLVFALPVLLTAVGMRWSGRFLRASAVFGLALFIPIALGSHFAEVRAHMMILVLLLPCALVGLETLLWPDGAGQQERAPDRMPA